MGLLKPASSEVSHHSKINLGYKFYLLLETDYCTQAYPYPEWSQLYSHMDTFCEASLFPKLGGKNMFAHRPPGVSEVN